MAFQYTFDKRQYQGLTQGKVFPILYRMERGFHSAVSKVWTMSIKGVVQGHII
jgi:hypothetical protein